jgi:hypothetical protein
MKNQYEIHGDVTTIFINRKDGSILETIIDTEDLERLKEIHVTWGCSPKERYVRATLYEPQGRVRFRLHRIIANTPDNMVTDHINGNTLDNRKTNLRIVTPAQNSQNLKNAKCVVWDKNLNKWKVVVNQKYFGVYKNVNNALKIANYARATIFPYSKEARLIPKENLGLLNQLRDTFSADCRSGNRGTKRLCKPTINWHSRDNLWQVRVTVNRKRKYLGNFKTKEEAEKYVQNLKY